MCPAIYLCTIQNARTGLAAAGVQSARLGAVAAPVACGSALVRLPGAQRAWPGIITIKLPPIPIAMPVPLTQTRGRSWPLEAHAPLGSRTARRGFRPLGSRTVDRVFLRGRLLSLLHLNLLLTTRRLSSLLEPPCWSKAPDSRHQQERGQDPGASWKCF